MSKRNKRIFMMVSGLLLLGLSIYAFRNRMLPDAAVGGGFGLSIGLIIISIFPRKEKVEKGIENN